MILTAYRKEYYEERNQLDKWRELKRRGKRRYYRKTSIYNGKERFTDLDCEKILRHDKTDAELSAEIHHSVDSIQIKQARLKAKLRKLEQLNKGIAESEEK